jgi:hypothetical protein
METIRLDGRMRVSLAEARALIVEALPVEGGAQVYATFLSDGTPDWEGPLTVRATPNARRGEAFIEGDLPAILKDLAIEPRLIMRPAWKDFGPDKPLADYSISRDEFIKLAECFGIAVVEDARVEGGVNAEEDEKPGDPVLKKGALIERVRANWKTIDADLREASRNGLKAAAHHGKGWSLNKALVWADSRGKLTRGRSSGVSASPWSGLQ